VRAASRPWPPLTLNSLAVPPKINYTEKTNTLCWDQSFDFVNISENYLQQKAILTQTAAIRAQKL
jgi:hypothetical protein